MGIEVYNRTGWAGGTRCSRATLGVFLAVGLALLVGGGYSFVHTQTAIATAASADGAVIELIDSRDSDGDTVYYPRVRFRTRAGNVVEFTGSVGSKPAAFGVGEAVKVLYDPERPGDARIDAFFQLWFLPIVLGGMGIIFAGIGGAGIAARRTGGAGIGTSSAATPTVPLTRAVDRRARD
jgi:Protein of unknown function (DUF3592)